MKQETHLIVLVSTKCYTLDLSSFDLILQIVKRIYHSFFINIILN